MLLKSIGQEEIVPGQTTVKDSGVYDELGQGMLYIEVSNRGAKNCAILEQRMDSHVCLIYGKSSFVKKKDDLMESGSQSNSEISTSHLNTSLLSMKPVHFLKGIVVEVEAITREMFLVSLWYPLQLNCVGNHIQLKM